MKEIIDRHKKIALHLSGGKDSVACLYVMRPFLDRITVYHVDAGDEPPETKAVLEKCREISPNYVTVKADVRGWISKNGYPSDIVPSSSSPIGRMLGFGKLPLVEKFACCWSNIMVPMYDQMKNDGVTLIIRGQKISDMPAVPLKSGQSADGIEVLYPLEDWTDDDVFRYLREVGAPIHDAYSVLREGVDCLHCTAWWDKKSVQWLRLKHPQAHDFVVKKHIEIIEAVNAQMKGFS